MKKIIILLLLPLYMFAQPNVGHSYNDLKKSKDFYKSEIKDGVKCIMTDNEMYFTYHYFNEDDLCFMSVVIPQSISTLNSTIKLLNDSFIKISNKIWHQYIIDVPLIWQLEYDTDLKIHYFIVEI